MKTTSSKPVNNIPVHQQDSELQYAFSPSSAMGPGQGVLAGGEVCMLQDLASKAGPGGAQYHPPVLWGWEPSVGVLAAGLGLGPCQPRWTQAAP